MSHLIIRNIEILDEKSPFHQNKMDIEIQDGKITNIAQQINTDSDTTEIIDGTGKYLSLSWVDMFGDVYTPGFEYRESQETGIAALEKGGFGYGVMSPNHLPEVYQSSHIQQLYQSNKGYKSKILFTGAISKKLEGKDLAEMYDMYISGAIAFTDGWSPVQNDLLLSQALEYVKSFKGLIYHIPVHKNLNAGGLMNESPRSTAFGISGQPSMSEDICIYTALSIAEYQNSRIHIAGVTTEKALNTIKTFKAKGVDVTCSVTPFHLLYNDSTLEKYESIYKVTPPLRAESDRLALIQGIEDGTIDAIASFNKPLSWDEKNKEFEYAMSGMASIQYVWPMLLKAAPHIPVTKWMDLLVKNPRQILGIQGDAAINVNYSGTLTLFDTLTPIQTQESVSQAFNTAPVNDTFVGFTQLI